MISSKTLEFDRECDQHGLFSCSISLDRGGNNIYCCLQCGKFFKGRSISTPAYDHFISNEHSWFINVTTLQIFDLTVSADPVTIFNDPDMIRVVRENLKPSKFSTQTSPMIDAHGNPYFRGIVGLIGSSSLIHACTQLICHINSLRDQLLTRSDAVDFLIRAAKKMWLRDPLLRGRLFIHHNVHYSNAREAFMHLISTLDLHSLQGTVRISHKHKQDMHMGPSMLQKFSCLSLDLPPPPLFPDAVSGKLPVPQAQVEVLIRDKFNSGNIFYDAKGNCTAYDLEQLPEYLVLYFNGRPQNNTAVLFDCNSLTVNRSQFKLIGQICFDPMVRKYICLISVSSDDDKRQEWFRLEDQLVSKLLTEDALIVSGDIYLQVWHKINK